MANELTEEEINKLIEDVMAGTEDTAKFGKVTEATEEEAAALLEIMEMEEAQARRYNQMGKELEEKDLYDNAVKWYIKAAEMGNADAQVNLGVFYHLGHAVKQDYAKALEWFTKAAQQGDAGAQYLTANALYNNRGAPPNMTAKDREAQALYWYKKSAAQGAQNSIASSGVDEKINTAWRTANAAKTNKGARDLSRAARPEDQ